MMLSKIIEISSALSTTTVAIIGTYIAIKQWKTNEANRRYELFNERYKNIYLEALNFYLEIKNMVYNGAEFDDTIELYEKYQEKLYKYRFFIKESDFYILQNLLSSFTSELDFYLGIRNKKEISKEEKKRKENFELNYYKIEKQIYLVMEKYLRIEKEHNFFSKIKNIKMNSKDKFSSFCYFYFPTFQKIFFSFYRNVPRVTKFKIKSFVSKIFMKRIF